MTAPLSQRCSAEAIEQYGYDLAALDRAFTKLCERMPSWMTDRINQIAYQDQLDTIAESFRKLGDKLCSELDRAEEAEDSRRANPLEPDFRRLG